MQDAQGGGALPCTSADAAWQRLKDGLATGSGVIPLALAQGQAQAAGAEIRVEHAHLSASLAGTKVTLLLPKH